jgi:YHS domain-containing protein
MSDLATFTEHLQDVLRDAYRIPHWTPEEAEKYMAEYGARRHRFEQLAHDLNQDVVSPRLEMVASFFANTRMQDELPSNRSSCWFEFCQRFPAVAQLDFAIEHDIRFEKLIIHMRTRIMPAIVHMNEQDHLPLSLDSVGKEKIADWVEERLLEFLDTYLRIDAGNGGFFEEPAMDPVCGMRIVRSSAAATDIYNGYPYYFCCVDCLMKFQEDSAQYV